MHKPIEIPEPLIPPRSQVDALVEASARTHGHLCPGQVVGVRMAILGLRLLGYGCPLGMPEIKDVVGIVEIERCLTDAVLSATGLRFGRGSLKLINTGLLAATFLDVPRSKAVRVLSRDDARDAAKDYAPNGPDSPHAIQEAAYRIMPDHELFDAAWVQVDLSGYEMPGARIDKVPCDDCGIAVRSGQIRRRGGRNLCPVCAGEAYFTYSEERP